MVHVGLTDQTITTTGVICQSAGMREILEKAKRASLSRSKVLITGETGVGKEVVARYIHASSPDAKRPFVALNCAGLPDTLLESELFGHVKGSFTGAYRDKPGKLQQAHGGTIFLDEVGEMTPRMQALLLRFLDTGEVQRVGEDEHHADIKVNARVITATNRDLPQLALQGLFRQDLLFRIRVVHLHVPPLRERREDIRPLLHHFIERLAPALRLTNAAWDAIGSYRWPGNVRELQNVIEQLALVASDRSVDVDLLPWVNTALPGGRIGRERRRDRDGIADELLAQIAAGHGTFWDQVYDTFVTHDLTRHNLRDFIALALERSGGSYRDMLPLLRLPDSDYKRLLKFLSRHDCAVDFRRFRFSVAARCRSASSQSVMEPFQFKIARVGL
jgi:transcriptional regulator with GAF, ATPase, and Fis domain